MKKDGVIVNNNIDKSEKVDELSFEKSPCCFSVEGSMTRQLQPKECSMQISQRSDGTIEITLRGVKIIVSNPTDMQKIAEIFEVQSSLREEHLAQEKNVKQNKAINEQKIPEKMIINH